MKASVGDHIEIASNRVDRAVRDGRIIEIRGTDGDPPYVVEWSDTHHTAMVYPGPDARIEHSQADPAGPGGPTGPTGAAVRTKVWHVEVHVSESDRETTAHAVLRSEVPESMEGHGTARRRLDDQEIPVVGDEIAVGRALHRLGDRLISAAAGDLKAAHGHDVSVHG